MDGCEGERESCGVRMRERKYQVGYFSASSIRQAGWYFPFKTVWTPILSRLLTDRREKETDRLEAGERETDRQTDRQKNWRDRQTQWRDRQTDWRQTERVCDKTSESL